MCGRTSLFVPASDLEDRFEATVPADYRPRYNVAPDAALHGHQVGVGAIMTAYLHGGEDGVWRDIRDALASIDAPTTAAELGIDDETVIEALSTCHAIRDRYTILGDGMDETAAREVARATGVIG